METFYIDKYEIKVDADNARVGELVDVYVQLRESAKFVSCYRVTRMVDDTIKDLAKRAYVRSMMGTEPDSKTWNEKKKRGIVDETGATRYTMTVDSLNRLYKRLEDFIADCTQQEYDENKVAIAATMALIHKHINAESK